MFPYDLHAHSNHSDGDVSVEEVVKEAQRAGLKGVVVTDHNVTTHFDGVARAAQRVGLWTCQGLEITSSYRGVDIHLLGYSLSFDRSVLTKGLVPVQEGYNERAQQIIEKLSDRGSIELDFEKIRATKPAQVVFRYDIAKAITSQGKFSLKDAQQVIGRSGSAWVPYGPWVPQLSQVIDLIHQSNGIAVLGHPGDVKRGLGSAEKLRKLMEQLIEVLADAGLDGIEVRHSSHTEDVVSYLMALAQRYGLMVSGGSDWHGEIHHPEITLGMAGISRREFEVFLKYLSE